MTPNSRPNLATQAALLFAGAFCGTAAGILLTRPAADPRAAAPPSTEDLEGALAALTREVEGLRREIPALAAAAEARRVELAQADGARSAVPSTSHAPAVHPQKTTDPARPVKILSEEEIVRVAEELHRREDPASVRAEHFYWTPEQILDRYGVPSSVSGDGGNQMWWYGTANFGARHGLAISFTGGRVTHVQVIHP